MIKKYIACLLFLSLVLDGCSKPNDELADSTDVDVDQQDNLDGQNNIDQQSNQESATNPLTIIKEIPELNIKIGYPDPYFLMTDLEENRRGSFTHYIWDNPGRSMPGYTEGGVQFSEIQFFSRESIEKFNAECAETMCFEGDFPDVERYDGQKEAFERISDYKNYHLFVFNNRNYLVANIPCSGDTCVIREYTTFIGDTKVDVWITMSNDNQQEQADQLFGQFSIIE